MQAIILAAGMGKRLKDLTQNNTKCMVKVNGVTLIERMLRQIDDHNLSRIVIVVGYEGKKLMDYIGTLGISTPIRFIENPVYDRTNNIYSLALASAYLQEDDTLLFESDVIFEDSVLDDLIHDPRETLALVDKYEPWMDGTCLKLDAEDRIVEVVPGSKFRFEEVGVYYKTVNLYKFSKHFSVTHYVPFLEAYQKALGENEYYEQVLRVIANLDDPEITAKRLRGQRWYEIDDKQDLDIAESLFAADEERIDMLKHRYGGYWRYPKLLDFCYLVNPYYPPRKMKDEIKASADLLLTEYPSGMRVNSLLAERNFSIHIDNIVVGNGAAELIKSLMAVMQEEKRRLGFIRPTFEEYPNRYPEDLSVIFRPGNNDFSYTADDIISFYEDKDISGLVLINPDNPSGSFIGTEGILKLIRWSARRGIKLIIDESFIDFADDTDASVLRQDILDANRHLYVVKSISKSYGIPGARLGILASGDKELIAHIKKDVAIWNINSIGEFFMQICEKYRKDYEASLKQLRAERKRFAGLLGAVSGVRVIPSQANYFMIELSGMTSSELELRLLARHNILIKDLSSKTGGNYIRVAIRTSEDNDRLAEALAEEMSRVK